MSSIIAALHLCRNGTQEPNELIECHSAQFRRLDTPLLPGSRVALGDLLYLEIEGSKSMHVYVLNEDEGGKAFVLFPLPGSSEQNPLSSNVRHRLPGRVAGPEKYWEVSSVGGEESFLVFACKRPLEELERQVKELHIDGWKCYTGNPYAPWRMDDQ